LACRALVSRSVCVSVQGVTTGKTSAAQATWAFTQQQAQVLTTEIIEAEYRQPLLVSRQEGSHGVTHAGLGQFHVGPDSRLELGQFEVFVGRVGEEHRTGAEKERLPPG
jgi:hypothetical protein